MPTDIFADGSPRYDHGHLPDGTVWEADAGDDAYLDQSVPPSEHPLPGIARYAIAALRPGDVAPDAASPFIRRWRRSRARTQGPPRRRGHAMGEVRTCPACRHDHAVGTTCRGCRECRKGDLVAIAEEILADLLPGGADAHEALLRHDHNLGRHAACDGTCGLPDCRGPYLDARGLTRYPRDEATPTREMSPGAAAPADRDERSDP